MTTRSAQFTQWGMLPSQKIGVRTAAVVAVGESLTPGEPTVIWTTGGQVLRVTESYDLVLVKLGMYSELTAAEVERIGQMMKAIEEKEQS